MLASLRSLANIILSIFLLLPRMQISERNFRRQLSFLFILFVTISSILLHFFIYFYFFKGTLLIIEI